MSFKQHGTTIVLGVLCAIFALWLLLDRDEISKGERTRRENNVFPAWRRDELTRIEIDRGLENLVLVRDATKDSTWSMTAPRSERTDYAAIEKLLTTLELATVQRKVTEGDLGFATPRAKGTIAMGGLVLRFVLGGPSPRPEGSAYFRVDGGAPFVVSKELADVLLAGADTYRTKSIVPYLSTELGRVEVKGQFTLARLDARLFDVDGLLAAPEEVDKVWSALADMRAEAFPKVETPGEPNLTIVLTPKDSKLPPAELRLGGDCPGEPSDVLVIRTAPTRLVACVPKFVVSSFTRSPASFVLRRPFALRGDEMEELRLEKVIPDDAGASPVAIEIARKGGGFHQRAPLDRELLGTDAEGAVALVESIEKLSAQGANPRAARPFEAVYRARVRSGDHEETVEIGAATEARVAIRRVRDDALLEVPRVVGLRLVPRETSLRPRSLVTDPRPVKKVILRCGVGQTFVDSGAGLRLTEPTGYETDSSITQLVDALTRGKVDRWIADDGAYGVTPDGCRVVLGFEDGNAPVTVRFGAEEDGEVYGVVAGSPHVFAASPALLTLAKSIFVSRAALRVDASEIEAVKVTTERPVNPNPLVLKDGVQSFLAESVASLGEPEVGAVDLTIDVTLADAGTKKITCGKADTNDRRRCATPSVRAVFVVPRAQWLRLLASGDGGGLPQGARAP